MTTVRRLRAEIAAQLVETGFPEEVWLTLHSVCHHIASFGIHPAELLNAVAAGAIQVRYFGPGDVPPDPDPNQCGINAAELLGWLLEQDATPETVH